MKLKIFTIMALTIMALTSTGCSDKTPTPIQKVDNTEKHNKTLSDSEKAFKQLDKDTEGL